MEQPKRKRRTKEEMEADRLKEGVEAKTTSLIDQDSLMASQVVEPYKPVKKKRAKKKVTNEKDKSSYVQANLDPSYMISPVAREECYVYAVKKVKFDEVEKQQKVGREFLLTFRVQQVHETAVWDTQNNEIEIDTIYESLLAEYGLLNVKLVNDPYEYE
jgi:hypothetical protein